MKLIRLFLAAFFVFAALPLEGHCDELHVDEPIGHHCVLTCCHSTNHSADFFLSQLPVLTLMMSEVASSQEQIYENPILLTLIKPPIVVS